MKSKKIINDGADAVDEMLAGDARGASPPSSRGDGQPAFGGRASTVRARARSALVIGGGSGHEPTFLGFVGKGLADAAAIGNVFASPPPDPILECAKAASGGAGVLYMYGNYAGDVMNFDMAAEMAAMDDIEVRTVLTTDDVASAPRDRRAASAGASPATSSSSRRRARPATGCCPSTRCERMAPQGQRPRPSPWAWRWRPARCRRPGGRISRSARTRWRSAWASTASPALRAGRWTPPTRSSTTMMDRILAEMAPARGDRVAVLVNSLGSTPLMELYIMNRRVAAAAGRSRRRHSRHLGRQLLHLAGNGGRLGDPACTSTASCRRCSTIPATAPCSGRASMARIDGLRLTQMFGADRRRDRGRDRTRLCALDGVIGDADHGIAMALGFGAAREALVRRMDPAVGADGGAQHGGQGVPERRRRLVRPALRHGADARRRGGQGQGRARRRRRRRDGAGDGQGHSATAARPTPARRRWSTPGRRPPRQPASAGGAGSSLAGCLGGGRRRGTAGRGGDQGHASRPRGVRRGSASGRCGHIDPGAASAVVVLEAMARSLSD